MSMLKPCPKCGSTRYVVMDRQCMSAKMTVLLPKRGMNEMSYQSPIEIIQEQAQTALENEVLKTVMHVGVVVDKEELIKALAYDRNQYSKGYNDRDSEIVRCKDCKECYFASNRIPTEQSYVCGKHGTNVSLEWFCADGERES